MKLKYGSNLRNYTYERFNYFHIFWTSVDIWWVILWFQENKILEESKRNQSGEQLGFSWIWVPKVYVRVDAVSCVTSCVAYLLRFDIINQRWSEEAKIQLTEDFPISTQELLLTMLSSEYWGRAVLELRSSRTLTDRWHFGLNKHLLFFWPVGFPVTIYFKD